MLELHKLPHEHHLNCRTYIHNNSEEKTGEKQATAKKVVVKQGQNYNGQVEILSGLKKGDWVISTGFQDVNNGEAVAF